MKQYSTDAFKAGWKRAVQNEAEATGNLIGNKIDDAAQSNTLATLA